LEPPNGQRAVGVSVAAPRSEGGNDRARALYERSGYSRTGDVPGYYADGATALRYLKQLPDEDADAGSHPGNERWRA
jgi:hypothetical protein